MTRAQSFFQWTADRRPLSATGSTAPGVQPAPYSSGKPDGDMADYPFAPSISYSKNSHGYRKTLTSSAYVSNLSKNINRLRLPTLVFYTFAGVGNRPDADGRLSAKAVICMAAQVCNLPKANASASGRAFWKAHRASVPNWYSASIISSFAAVLLIHNASLNDQD